jgi:hypothetical protein
MLDIGRVCRTLTTYQEHRQPTSLVRPLSISSTKSNGRAHGRFAYAYSAIERVEGAETSMASMRQAGCARASGLEHKRSKQRQRLRTGCLCPIGFIKSI